MEKISALLTRTSALAITKISYSDRGIYRHGRAVLCARLFSTATVIPFPAEPTSVNGPHGPLFNARKEIGPQLIGQTGSIHRIFGPRSNAEAMLVTGGEALAAHASFDPVYDRAANWIRHHAVGYAALSPVLIHGLTGALVEAAFPQSVPVRQQMNQNRPLIVGCPIIATIEVVTVEETDYPLARNDLSNHLQLQESAIDRRYGYKVELSTAVKRARDDAVIAHGEHVVWIPDYLHM